MWKVLTNRTSEAQVISSMSALVKAGLAKIIIISLNKNVAVAAAPWGWITSKPHQHHFCLFIPYPTYRSIPRMNGFFPVLPSIPQFLQNPANWQTNKHTRTWKHNRIKSSKNWISHKSSCFSVLLRTTDPCFGIWSHTTEVSYPESAGKRISV